MPDGQQVGCNQEAAVVSPNCGEGITDLYVKPRDFTPVGTPLKEGWVLGGNSVLLNSICLDKQQESSAHPDAASLLLFLSHK